MGAKVIILAKSLIPHFLRACAIVQWGRILSVPGNKEMGNRKGMKSDRLNWHIFAERQTKPNFARV